jgi:hypothetical protein
MNTVAGAVVGLLVLSAGGALPAVGLARFRLVAIPLAPLAGAVLASLAVTSMAALNGSVFTWYVVLSLLSAGVVLLCWRRFPQSRPWGAGSRPPVARGMYVAAVLGSLVVCVIGLSALKAPMTGFDTRDIWLLHPIWYLQGHAETLATLRGTAYQWNHPPYPPLIGGSVAVTWFLTGANNIRLGVVMVTLLNGLAMLAVATAIIDVASRLAGTSQDALQRRRTRIAGVVLTLGIVVVAFSTAGVIISDGYADVLWSTAAVGAVAYGLVLPLAASNIGAAAILVSVAGLTKLEGSLTAAVIVGLIAARLLLALRASGWRRWSVRAGGYAIALWAVIGAWPLVIRLLGALPNVPIGGARVGNDGSRFAATVHGAVLWAHPHLVVLGLAAIVTLVGACFLRDTRRGAGLGNDLWGWATVCAALVVVVVAYVDGPGSAPGWIHSSILRTTMFPCLEAWWIMATWAVIAVHGARSSDGAGLSPHVADDAPSEASERPA